MRNVAVMHDEAKREVEDLEEVDGFYCEGGTEALCKSSEQDCATFPKSF